jgi:hypothetical protein
MFESPTKSPKKSSGGFKFLQTDDPSKSRFERTVFEKMSLGPKDSSIKRKAVKTIQKTPQKQEAPKSQTNELKHLVSSYSTKVFSSRPLSNICKDTKCKENSVLTNPQTVLTPIKSTQIVHRGINNLSAVKKEASPAQKMAIEPQIANNLTQKISPFQA